MAGPKVPWKYFGAEMTEIFVYNPSAWLESNITLVTVGDKYRVTLTYMKECFKGDP